MRTFNILPILFVLALGATPARAQPVAPKPLPPKAPLGSALAPAPTWSTLTPAEQEALRPLAGKFDELTAFQRLKWKEMAARYPAWPEDKRQRIQSRMLAWASMTPEQRGAARQEALSRQTSGAPSGINGSKPAESWRRWQELDDEQRDQLHNRAVAPLSPR